MNLHRLAILEAVIANDFNISRASLTLRLTQPGLSKQLQILEEELGFEVFTRMGRRLTGLTELGREAHRLAQQILGATQALGGIRDGYVAQERGALAVATTHTQARYALPRVVQAFRGEFPDVRLALHQSSPAQASDEVLSGKAELAIASEAISESGELCVLPCYEWNRSVIAPKGHPILQKRSLSLQQIAQFPIITYADLFTGRSQVDAAFSALGLVPDVVLTAIDADIIKTYVKLGLGIGIVASMAMEEADEELVARDASHLFRPSTTWVGIRRGSYLRGFAYRFIELVAPHLTREVVDRALGH